MAFPDIHLYYVSAQLSQIRTLKSAQPEDALYQLWQCLLKTDLPPFYAILSLNLYKKKQMTSNSSLVESQKLSLKWSLQLVQPAILELQTPLWYNSKLAPLDKLPTPKEWIRAELQNLILRKNTIKARAQWERSIDFITDDQWTQVLLTPLNIYPIYKYRILQLYLIHRAYYTRSRLHKINPDIPDTCVRCNAAEGMLIHTIWSCPVLNEYWAKIQKRITTILGFELPLDPKWYILERRLIAQQWKSQLPPLYADWEKSVQSMCNVEQLIARRNNNSDQCMKIWQLWILENV
ncbi:hypothetical protein XELAEV_18020989mg [Xenopus laevis]|uniref:Reverse transcriptase zinc-binding domain-containing protein n=1 Tax=Xenopus laevis TaxID=8355 RepID=A0A974DAN5_XENLA|nr:hypothetical protein XELAEV_18020989mg [Xenopus laevis]